MKRTFLLLAILMISSAASADDIAHAPNQAGGEIVLTNQRASICPNDGTLVYSVGHDGTTITGCWWPGEHYVVIQWNRSGTIKLFDYNQFLPFNKAETDARGTVVQL